MIVRHFAQWLWRAIVHSLAKFCFRLAGKPLLMEALAPLTASELQEIADFLRQHDVHWGYLADLYALDGFLTCVVIGPEPIPAGEWLAALFGGTLPASAQLDCRCSSLHGALMPRPVGRPCIRNHNAFPSVFAHRITCVAKSSVTSSLPSYSKPLRTSCASASTRQTSTPTPNVCGKH